MYHAMAGQNTPRVCLYRNGCEYRPASNNGRISRGTKSFQQNRWRGYPATDVQPTSSQDTAEPTPYRNAELHAVRSGKWKLHFTYYDHSKGGYTVRQNYVTPGRPLLFDVEVDPSEQYDVANRNPGVVAELTKIAEDYKAEIERQGENRELIDWFINDWATAPRRGE